LLRYWFRFSVKEGLNLQDMDRKSKGYFYSEQKCFAQQVNYTLKIIDKNRLVSLLFPPFYYFILKLFQRNGEIARRKIPRVNALTIS